MRLEKNIGFGNALNTAAKLCRNDIVARWIAMILLALTDVNGS